MTSNVLITGAGRGIGLELARQYAADGWRVRATCRDTKGASALEGVYGDVLIHRLDVTEGVQVAALARDLKGEPIDLLINNAGMTGARDRSFGNLDYDIWEEVFRVNALAPVRVAEALVDLVAASERKLIVSISSRMGSIDANNDGGSYSYRSSKAALNAAMKSLSIDLAGREIMVVVFHPGWVRTDMGGKSASLSAKQSAEEMRAVIDRLTLSDSGRFLNYDGTDIPW
ncbi:MAG: SDR family oxidoreductase [Alphaproteobacteria bacterium]|nr:SDR family oxidoreductase [Alphaproteobacteria bacterium]